MSFNLTQSKQVKLLPITITDEKNSEIVRSAVCAMLKPECDMFQKGEVIKAIIILLSTNEKNVSSLLGLSVESVKRKLSLLCFSQMEKSLILKSNLSEMSTYLLSKLPYLSRHFAVLHCTKHKLTFSQTKAYVDSLSKKSLKLHSFCKTSSNHKTKLGFINNIGIVINSIDRAIDRAKESGFNVKYDKNEDPDCFSIFLSLAKKQTRQH